MTIPGVLPLRPQTNPCKWISRDDEDEDEDDDDDDVDVVDADVVDNDDKTPL
jgi:hypothetical protein